MLRSAKFQQLSQFPVSAQPAPHLKLYNYRNEEEIIKRQIHTHIQHTVSEESDGSMLVRKEGEYAEEALGFSQV